MFQKALDTGLTKEQRMDRLVKNNDYIVMPVSAMQVSSRIRKMKLYHSFANLGGTFHNPNNKIVALDGFGATATPIIIQPNDLESNFEVVAPNFEALSDRESWKEVETLNKEDKKIVKAPNFIFIPPFLARVLIGIESRLPEDFLVATISTIISFDNNKEQNEKNLASEYCEYVA